MYLLLDVVVPVVLSGVTSVASTALTVDVAVTSVASTALTDDVVSPFTDTVSGTVDILAFTVDVLTYSSNSSIPTRRMKIIQWTIIMP